MQGKEGVRGRHWFTEEDRRTAAVLKLDKTGRAVTTILRHLSRLQEVRKRLPPGILTMEFERLDMAYIGGLSAAGLMNFGKARLTLRLDAHACCCL